jgi:hypothetical protein
MSLKVRLNESRCGVPVADASQGATMFVLRTILLILACALPGCGNTVTHDADERRPLRTSDGRWPTVSRARPTLAVQPVEVVGTISVARDRAVSRDAVLQGPIEMPLRNWNSVDEDLKRSTLICRGC